MIDQCFLHVPGIGPDTATRLNNAGFYTWDDCLADPDRLPLKGLKKDVLIQTLTESKIALQNETLEPLIKSFPKSEHWRILERYLDEATYFDIETTGLSWFDSHITVISAYRKGKVKSFIYDENLDDFLDLVDDSKLLVSFNGNSFDVPTIERHFNIPRLVCPHIDLRWVCYHKGFKGGLKDIETQLGLIRPPDVQGVDGALAVILWQNYLQGNQNARDLLIKYCEADAQYTYLVTKTVLSLG